MDDTNDPIHFAFWCPSPNGSHVDILAEYDPDTGKLRLRVSPNPGDPEESVNRAIGWCEQAERFSYPTWRECRAALVKREVRLWNV